MPTDEAFSAQLLDDIRDAFENTLPKCVLEDLHDKKDSRVIYLWSGYVTGYDEYLLSLQRKAIKGTLASERYPPHFQNKNFVGRNLNLMLKNDLLWKNFLLNIMFSHFFSKV